MGYTWKATMYYTDEETKDFLAKKSKKTNGKIISDSSFLYSLVTKARISSSEDTGNNNEESSDALRKNLGVFIYPPFSNFVEKILKTKVTFSSIDAIKNHSNNPIKNVSENRLRQLKIKDLIMEWFLSEFDVDEYRYGTDAFTIIIITKVACVYLQNKDDSLPLDCEGLLDAQVVIVNVNKELWGKYHNRYDFSKINYLKYEKVSNLEAAAYDGLAKIREIGHRDKTGGYFIPVVKSAKEYPSTLIGETIIIGGDSSNGVNRVNIKPMSESAKEKFISRKKRDLL